MFGMIEQSSANAIVALGPKTRVCYVCGRLYGIHSFEIHLKQCKDLWIAREAEKDPRERKKLPDDPMLKLTAATAGNSLNSPYIDNSKTLEELNRLATETFNTESMETCKFCARSFLTKEKLVIHNKSCTADNPARKVTDNVNRRPNTSSSGSLQSSAVSPIKPTLSSRAPTPAKRRLTSPSRRTSPRGDDADSDVTRLKVEGGELRRVQSPPARPHLSGSAGRSLRKSASPSEQTDLDSELEKDLSRREIIQYLKDEISRIEQVAMALGQSISSLKDVISSLSTE